MIMPHRHNVVDQSALCYLFSRAVDWVCVSVILVSWSYVIAAACVTASKQLSPDILSDRGWLNTK